MRGLIALVLLSLPCIFAATGNVGAYLMLSRKNSSGKVVGLDELTALADHASSLPITRLYLAFFSPTMVYVPNSHTLSTVGPRLSTAADNGYSVVNASIQALQKAGIQVFLSMGGWNYNCYPYFYMRYSVGGYGVSTPNFWKIQQYGGGSVDNCVESNQFCYVCEPESEGTSLDDFSIFPEPGHSSTWQQAKDWVASGASASGAAPIWNEDMIPGSMYTDPKTGISTKVPGSSLYVTQNRDPYQDIVHLAKDLDAYGVDIDYEEFWHADFFKTGAGPWNLTQTVFKWSAIAYDVATNIKAIQPSLRLSTAGGAVGGWQGNWWGGNLKGLWYYAKLWMPFIIDFLTKGDNAGGINAMTYDLSDNTQFHECPTDDPSSCPLDKQVEFYMNAYSASGIAAAVGYEISTPAYPDKTHDPTHQLPLTTQMLSSIVSTTQTKHDSGFIWEIYKSVDSSTHASATQVAQTLCKKLIGTSRCSGSFPKLSATTRNVCSPENCNACEACCKGYMGAQTVCDECVATECQTRNVCSEAPDCNVCPTCCKSYLSRSQSACDECASEECAVPSLLSANPRSKLRPSK
eukprot:c5398_g1_i1.p1 GENE.c5398_g1_i1~~c5398_g1_i1.p1  ORF type:complete len:590 (+),score=106.74 c5398_g1_i1:46-1770(+)